MVGLVWAMMAQTVRGVLGPMGFCSPSDMSAVMIEKVGVRVGVLIRFGCAGSGDLGCERGGLHPRRAELPQVRALHENAAQGFGVLNTRV